jgi:hypothetical protein
MATTTNFGWETPDDTDLVKDGAAAIRTALGGVDTSFVDLKGGTTGQVLAKASNTDLDFVWSADAAGMTNPMTTAGDLIRGGTSGAPTRLGIGTSGQILTVSAGLPAWTTPAASGGMTLLSTTTLSTTTTTINSISGSYKNLFIVVRDWTTSSNGQVALRINNNSTADLHRFGSSWYSIPSTGSSSTGSGGIRSTSVNFNHSSYFNSNNVDSVATIDITDYADSSTYKAVKMQSNYVGEDGTTRWQEWKVGALESTTAISSLTFLGTTSMSGTVLIYGVN